jgi:hypothetical protein
MNFNQGINNKGEPNPHASSEHNFQDSNKVIP